jgi:hypothetical protein
MDYNAWLDELSSRTGASVEDSDRERLQNTNPDDVDRLLSAYESQYQRRGDSGQTGSGMDDKEATARGYGSGRNETADDRGMAPRPGVSGSGVAQAWNTGGAAGAGASGLFPDWYQELLTRQQSQMEAQQAENKARGDALYGQLNDRATQGLSVDRNNPVIRQQADAFSANADRARRNYISDTAESAGPLGNIQGERRMASERYGQMTGDFEAELLGRELSAKREEIAEALRMQGGLLSGDQNRNLSEKLAMYDNAIKEAGIGLGARGQDLDYSLGQQGIGLGARGQDLGMDQFLRELALREYDTVNRWDYNWMSL